MKRKILFICCLLLPTLYLNFDRYAYSQMQLLDSVSKDALPLTTISQPDGTFADGIILNQLGFQYYKSGDYINAIAYYKKAIDLSPDYPIPLNNLGVIYLKSNKLESARGCFSKAIALNPEYVKAICNLAVVFYKMGDFEAAKQLYQKAKHVDSNYVDRRIDNYLNQNK